MRITLSGMPEKMSIQVKLADTLSWFANNEDTQQAIDTPHSRTETILTTTRERTKPIRNTPSLAYQIKLSSFLTCIYVQVPTNLILP